MSVWTANLLLLIAGAVWGMGFIAQVGAMEHIGPMLFMGLRFTLAALCVAPFAYSELRQKSTTFERTHFVLLAPVGILFFISMALQQVGLMATTVTNAGFLTALYVVLVPLILLVMFFEPPNKLIWPAALLSLAGIFLLSGGHLAGLTWGDILVIIGSFFAALHVIYTGKRAVQSGTPVTMACLQFAISAVLGFFGHFTIGYLGINEPAATWSNIYGALPEVIYAGLFAGALSFTLMAIAQQYTTPAAAAILLSSESLFAALFGAILLSERLNNLGYVGCGMIFTSLLMVELAPYLSARLKPRAGQMR